MLVKRIAAPIYLQTFTSYSEILLEIATFPYPLPFNAPVGGVPCRAGFKGAQRASHQTVHILFLANDRCLRDYDLVVAHFDHCFS